MRRNAPKRGGRFRHHLELLRRATEDVFERLPERQRRAVRLFYGLNGEKPYKLRELAALFSVGVDTVGHWVKAAVKEITSGAQ